MYSTSPRNSHRCEACHKFFILEASLTKHCKHCSAVRKCSQKLWKNGASNIKKLSLSLKDSRKRLPVREEVHEDSRVHLVSPSVNNIRGLELVRILPILHPVLDDTRLSSTSGKPWFFFSCFKCFFYLPQVKKAHSVKSTEYFSQDIPFTFYTFSVLFSTFLLFFLGNIPKICTFLYFFVLFEQIYFKKVKYFF
jgi:hypothetical protein